MSDVTQSEANEAPASSIRSTATPTLLRILFDNSLLIAVPALVIFFSITAQNFLTVENFRDMFRFNSPTLVVAVPEALLLIAGLVDLSIGSVLAFGAVIAGLLMTHGVSVFLASVLGIGAGAAIGALNGDDDRPTALHRSIGRWECSERYAASPSGSPLIPSYRF